MKNELQLGLFIFLGVIALAISIMLVKNIPIQPGYRVHVVFNDVGGLLEKSWVRVSGVKVGKVETIKLFGTKAKVIAWIDKKSRVEIHTDAEAKILATGLLGVKYLEFTLGSEHKPVLKRGDTIIGTDPVGLDEVFSRLTEEEFADSLLKTINNIKGLTEKINRSVSEEKINSFIDRIAKSAEQIEKITRDISEITGKGKKDIEVALKNFRSISERLDRILADIEAGEGAIGKLVSDKEIGEDLKETVKSIRVASNEAKKTISRFTLFKTKWNYELRNDNELNRQKSDVGIEIRPKDDKFYYLGVRNMTGETEVNPPEKENTFDLNIGRDFGLLTLYAGIIRSAGGVGIKARPSAKRNLWNRFELQAQAYDFARKTPERKVRVDLGVKVKIGKYVKIGVGLEDIYIDNHLHSSANIMIDDEDIAYLLGLVTLSP